MLSSMEGHSAVTKKGAEKARRRCVSASKRYSLCIVETSLFNAGFLGRLAQLFLFKISHVSGLHLKGLWS